MMKLEELNEQFINGDIDFDNYVDEYVIDGEYFRTYRDFNTLIKIGRAQKEGVAEITYIGESGHLNFKYKYDKGSLIPECVYIKSKDILEREAKETWSKFMSVDESVDFNDSKILKFKDF